MGISEATKTTRFICAVKLDNGTGWHGEVVAGFPAEAAQIALRKHAASACHTPGEVIHGVEVYGIDGTFLGSF